MHETDQPFVTITNQQLSLYPVLQYYPHEDITFTGIVIMGIAAVAYI
jgi:hypothetical protein